MDRLRRKVEIGSAKIATTIPEDGGGGVDECGCHKPCWARAHDRSARRTRSTALEDFSRAAMRLGTMEIVALDKHQRRKALQRHLQSYRTETPGLEDAAFLRKDMARLIKQTTKGFGQVEQPIVHVEIREDGERYSVFAVSIRTEEGR